MQCPFSPNNKWHCTGSHLTLISVVEDPLTIIVNTSLITLYRSVVTVKLWLCDVFLNHSIISYRFQLCISSNWLGRQSFCCPSSPSTLQDAIMVDSLRHSDWVWVYRAMVTGEGRRWHYVSTIQPWGKYVSSRFPLGRVASLWWSLHWPVMLGKQQGALQYPLCRKWLRYPRAVWKYVGDQMEHDYNIFHRNCKHMAYYFYRHFDHHWARDVDFPTFSESMEARWVENRGWWAVGLGTLS